MTIRRSACTVALALIVILSTGLLFSSTAQTASLNVNVERQQVRRVQQVIVARS
jgi:hypothetical protein